jgi:CheY-like chemotaxis protein
VLASKRNILVVEDEPLLRLVLSSALEDAGYSVLEAGTVLQAIALLSKYEIDGVMTDVDMPGGLSGLDLVDLISALEKPCRIVVTSGRTLPADYDLPSAAIFIPKPYVLENIIETLEQFLPRLPIVRERRAV